MKTKTSAWIIPGLFFLVFAICNLMGKLFYDPMANFTKPALLPLLSLTTLAAVGNLESRGVRLLIVAQLLGCVGDVLLLFNGFFPFIGGMVAFLAGHVCYMTLFGGVSWKKLTLKTWIPSVLVMVAIVGGLISFIGVEGDLLVPMCVYGMVLMLLIFSGLAGVVRFGGSWWYVLAGALIFTLSDAMIAVETFQEEPAFILPFLVMFTYLVAQVLLAVGALKLIPRS